jgi:phosphoesterase RecJ-like protein
MLADVLKTVEENECFVLTSHARPDGDAIGSVLACGEVLRKLGKTADVVLSDGVPVIYKPLPFADDVIHARAVSGKYEAAVILECDSVQRTRLIDLDKYFLVNIDHHQSGKPFGHVNWIDPSACATAEMIYKLSREAGVKVTPEMATCLYTAVLTDTGSFCYAGTNPNTFALAEELVRAGADPVRIAQSVYFSNPSSKMRLLGAALSTLECDGKLTWMHVTRQQMRKFDALEEDCEGLVNYALSIKGVEIAAFFREIEGGRWRVSLRSKGNVPVRPIAESLGGGGHECASGFSLPGSLDKVSQQVLTQLRAALSEASLQ